MAPLTYLILSSLLILLSPTPAHANTEKVIFLGPEEINVPLTPPTITDLNLPTLTPNFSTLRTKLSASFPSHSSPLGTSTWLILDNLTPSQRYEVRICWAATQPTSFILTTYPLEVVFDTPELITSLNDYSVTRFQHPPPPPAAKAGTANPTKQEGERTTSLLLLHIQSAADYFTSNATLMTQVPPVEADVILDPFLFNVLPRSLVPTVTYIILVALTSFYLASRISTWIQELATTTLEEEDGDYDDGDEKKRQ
ncbi:hypothetical protein QBC42DRAFT_203190 [Cladorrhinum samala]|uniref:Uncharacterized protein n=1 Tax=Cladorrhinum samala TaxID=585594 RepID=A0AAV9HRK9_9PEZI|nr:hypothetical protein QBC42DRAFT_203190 [Cladorrhinum samala]